MTTRYQTNRYPAPALVASAISTLLLASSASAGLQVAVAAGPEPARQSELCAVEITVTNDDAFDRTNVSLTMVIPSSIESIDDSFFGGDCGGSTCDAGETVTFLIPYLAAGQGRTFVMPTRIAGGAPVGAILPFSVSAFDDGQLQATASSELTVTAARLLNLGCADSADPVAPGDSFSYRLTYGVRETSSGAANALLSLPLPVGTTFISASHGGGLVGNEVQWPLGALAPGAVGERTVNLLVSNGLAAGEILLTEARLTSNGGNEVAVQHATRVEWESGLRCSFVTHADPLRTGELGLVEVTVSNAGLFDRTGVSLVVRTPDSFAAIDDSLFPGDCVGSTCDATEPATFLIGDLPAGQGVTYSIPVTAIAATLDGTVIPFRATVSDVSTTSVDAASLLAISDARIVNLAVSDRRDPVAPGEHLPFTLTYGIREGSAGIAGATLLLPVPDGTQFVSASDGGSLVGDVVQWSLGNLGPGAVGERSATFVVAGDTLPGAIIESEATFRDSGVRYATGGSTTRVELFEELGIAIAASPDSAMSGELIDVEVTVTNASAFDRDNVLVTVLTPSGFDALDDTWTDGDCVGSTCDPTEPQYFSVGFLRAGEGRSFWVPYRVASSVLDGSIIPLRAEVSDGIGGLRIDETAIAVRDQRVLNLALTERADSVQPGETQVLTITYGVRETSGGASGVALKLPVPEGMTFVGASDGGALVNGVVQWTLGNLGPGTVGERKASFLVAANATPGTIARAEATLADAGINITRAEASTRVELNNDIEVLLTASPDPVRVDEVVDLEVTVANRGLFDRAGVTLRLLVADGFGAFGETNHEGDCPGSTCDAGETSTIVLGTLRAGDVKTFSYPFRVSASALDGTVRRWTAIVSDAAGAPQHASTAIAVDDTRPIELGMQTSRAHVAPGETISCTFFYGSLANGGGSPNATLRCFVPEGMSFVSASDGGTANSGVVTWPLGSVAAGAGGRRTVVLAVQESVPTGSALVVGAQFADIASPVNEVRTERAIAVSQPRDLVTSIKTLPEVRPAGSVANVQVVVTNNALFDRTGVSLRLEFPQGFAPYSDTGSGGDCPGSTCDEQELFIANIGTLASGESACISISPTILANLPAGNVVSFDLVTTDELGDRSSQSALLFVGSQFSGVVTKIGDLNGDGAVGAPDVAILLGAWGSNSCPEPADLNGDGSVGAPDLGLILGNWG